MQPPKPKSIQIVLYLIAAALATYGTARFIVLATEIYTVDAAQNTNTQLLKKRLPLLLKDYNLIGMPRHNLINLMGTSGTTLGQSGELECFVGEYQSGSLSAPATVTFMFDSNSRLCAWKCDGTGCSNTWIRTNMVPVYGSLGNLRTKSFAEVLFSSI